MEQNKVSEQYQRPKITTYSEEEIIELIGPANTCGSDIGNHGLHLGWTKGKGNPHK